MSDTNNTDSVNTLAKKKLQRLLSPRGVFMVYSPKEFLKSLPFKVAITAFTLYCIASIAFDFNQTEILKYLVDKFLNMFPNLLGFSLGGYAIIVGFGNTSLIKKMAKSVEEPDAYSAYQILNSVFAFNLYCQAAVLFISIAFDFSFFITKQLGIDIGEKGAEFFNCVGAAGLVFLSTWALLIIPYLVSNIFIFGEVHHIILKNEPDEKNHDQK